MSYQIYLDCDDSTEKERHLPVPRERKGIAHPLREVLVHLQLLLAKRREWRERNKDLPDNKGEDHVKESKKQDDLVAIKER